MCWVISVMVTLRHIARLEIEKVRTCATRGCCVGVSMLVGDDEAMWLGPGLLERLAHLGLDPLTFDCPTEMMMKISSLVCGEECIVNTIMNDITFEASHALPEYHIQNPVEMNSITHMLGSDLSAGLGLYCFTNFPSYLFIQIQRNATKKRKTEVPQELSLQDGHINFRLCVLVAKCSVRGGHYKTYVKRDDTFTQINDSHVIHDSELPHMGRAVIAVYAKEI